MNEIPLGDDPLVETASPPGGWPTPRSLYVHVPFCRHRCGYCNFSVVADRDDLIDRYLGAIDRELASLDRPEVETLFIGGGTPTHLNETQWHRLIASIGHRVRFAEQIEFSVEANPEDIDAAKTTLLAGSGVNRLSLGVQSFAPNKLAVLERGHGREAAIAAIEAAAKAIPNVSVDLIFAAPGETIDSWSADVETALSLPIQHLSTYSLTFEKGTTFWTRQLKCQLHKVAEEDEVSMYQRAREATAAAGWDHYEISNFASPGNQCRHNLAYWQGRGWFAAGPGAAKFVAGRREVNHRSTTAYLKRVEAGASPVAESEVIGLTQYARERAAFGMRLIEGINLDKLSNETGVDLQAFLAGTIDRLLEQRLITATGPRLRLTERGILFADTVAGEFLG